MVEEVDVLEWIDDVKLENPQKNPQDDYIPWEGQGLLHLPK